MQEKMCPATAIKISVSLLTLTNSFLLLCTVGTKTLSWFRRRQKYSVKSGRKSVKVTRKDNTMLEQIASLQTNSLNNDEIPCQYAYSAKV